MAEDTTTTTTPDAPATTTTDATPPVTTDESTLLGQAPEGQETKPTETTDSKADVKADDKAADDKAIEYQDFKLPEDFKLDEKTFSDFKKVAAESGLSQDQAQGFIDMHVAMEKQRIESEESAFKTLQDAWKSEIRADKEIGGDKLPATLGAIARAIDEFGGKDAAALRQAFNYTGAGNNPQIVRFMARIASALSEGSPLPGTKPTSASKTAAEILYPNGGNTNLGNQHL